MFDGVYYTQRSLSEADGENAVLQGALLRSGSAENSEELEVVVEIIPDAFYYSSPYGVPPVVGSDYEAEYVTVNIAAGANSADIPVPLIDDEVFEQTEYLTVRVHSINGVLVNEDFPGTQTPIYDDDAPVISLQSIELDRTVISEGNPNQENYYEEITATITISAPAPTTSTTSVILFGSGNGLQNSANSQDFGWPSNWQVFFEPGQTTASFTTSITPDYLPEGDEVGALTVRPGSGLIGYQSLDDQDYSLRAEFVILDDDLPVTIPAPTPAPTVPVTTPNLPEPAPTGPDPTENPAEPTPSAPEPTLLIGTTENDELLGGANDERLSGLGGDDHFEGRGGNDLILGGAGLDTAVYSGTVSAYTLEQFGTSFSLLDRSGNNGEDTLTNVEFIEFEAPTEFQDPVVLNLVQIDVARSISKADMTALTELYIAYFNRAPDATGLTFWAEAFALGTTLSEMASLFVEQTETRLAYPEGLSNTDFAWTVYQNVLGRTPDQAGYDFWVGALDNYAVSRDQFILSVIEGAKAAPPVGVTSEFFEQQISDKEYLATKANIGLYFALEKGLSDTVQATETMEYFDRIDIDLPETIEYVDQLFTATESSENAGFLMPTTGYYDVI